MTKPHLSERRLVENEALFREMNERVQKGFDALNDMARAVGDDNHYGVDKDTVLSFYCECADINCYDRIELTLGAYEEIHKDDRSFVIICDHLIDRYEETVIKTNIYYVVRKRGDAPDETKAQDS